MAVVLLRLASFLQQFSAPTQASFRIRYPKLCHHPFSNVCMPAHCACQLLSRPDQAFGAALSPDVKTGTTYPPGLLLPVSCLETQRKTAQLATDVFGCFFFPRRRNDHAAQSSVRLGGQVVINWFLIKTVLYEAAYKILRASQYERKKEENHSCALMHLSFS